MHFTYMVTVPATSAYTTCYIDVRRTWNDKTSKTLSWEEIYLGDDHWAQRASTHNILMSQDMDALIHIIVYITYLYWKQQTAVCLVLGVWADPLS